MSRSNALFLLFTLFFVFGAVTPAVAQPRQQQLQSQWVFETDGAHPGATIHAAFKGRLGDHFHVQSNQPGDEYSIPTELVLNLPDGLTLRQIVYPRSTPFEVEGFEEPLLVFDSEFAIGVILQISEDVVPGTYAVTGELQYQACDNKICMEPTSHSFSTELRVLARDEAIAEIGDPVFDQIDFSAALFAPPPVKQPVRDSTTEPTPPAVLDCDVLAEMENFTLLGTAGGYLNANDFIAFIDGAEQGTLKKNFFENMGPVAIILVVIVGGVLLNLTPCVLPLIPINLAIIGAGAQAGSRSRGFALGGTYGLAMAVVYGALGLVVILTSSAFGQINSTIWFNVGIAGLFVVLALAMFDVIAIDFTRYQSKLDATKVAQRGTFALAFFMGCVTALLAGACVAPVVIQVVVYAGDQYARGIAIALALPFFLGLGMALPWPFAGAGMSFLPKPGMWMVRVKQAMGVFILAFAAYYGYLAFDIWDSKRVDVSAVQSAVNEQLEGGWTSSICAGLAQARAENKPVLIDMWATWCKNCLAMDRTTFKDERVIARLDGFIKVKYQSEDLSASPTRELLTQFEGVGLPHYAVLRPKN